MSIRNLFEHLMDSENPSNIISDATQYYNLGNFLLEQGEVKEAEQFYRFAVKIDPNFSKAYNNLGVTLSHLGKKSDALTAYQQAIGKNPRLVQAYINISMLFIFFEKFEEAIKVCRLALKIDPGNVEIKHMMATLNNEAPSSFPREYIENYFDQFARVYDRRLVQGLEYKIPAHLKEKINSVMGNTCYENVLDLGCGTGLVGEEIRSIANRLVGVDLSSKMLKKAKNKNLYDILHHCEIIDFLKKSEEVFDLITCADVLIYLGNLTPLFESIKRCASETDVFAFTIETSDKDDFLLHPTGRFTHSQKYIYSLSVKHGFSIKSCQSIALRVEKGKEVMGNLYILINH